MRDNAAGIPSRLPTDDVNPSPPALTPRIERALLVVVLGLTFIVHVHFVLHQNINWDEFFFLSFVYDYARGTLSTPLQSFHVHLFGWLTSIDGYEVDQVIAARTVFLLLLTGTCTCVYSLARRSASVNGALFAVLCCAAYSNILNHGTSFRTDGLSIFLLMVALVLVQRRTHRVLALSTGAVLVALALLITVKGVFLLPTVGVLLIIRQAPDCLSTRARREGFLFVGVMVAATVALYFWHRGTIVAPAGPDSVTYLQSVATTVIRRDVLFPGFVYFVGSVLANLVEWAFLTYAVVTLSRRLLVREQRIEALSLLALVLPLLSLLFYRNAFPYFYVLLMPPALVLCGFAFDQVTLNARMSERRGIPLAFVATLVIAGSVAANVTLRFRDGTAAQREVIRAVHEIFPQPVPYIDRNGMIASFPKVGFFMSTWGIQSYREAGQPMFAGVLRAHEPKFLVMNSPALASVFAESSAAGEESEQRLLAEDVAVLREHFVPYWGPVYVAGRAMHLQQGADIVWEVLVAGPYRLLSQGPVVIGNVRYAPGSTVEIELGSVSLRSSITQDIVLRTNSVQGVPSYPPPVGPIYTGF